MSERLNKADAARGCFRSNLKPEKPLVIVGALTGVVLAIGSCNSSEEINTNTPTETPATFQSIDCPKGVLGTPFNSVIVRSRGEEYDEEVLAVFEKYGACRDTVPEHLIEIDGGGISVPFVPENPEMKDEFLSALLELVEKGKLEGAIPNGGLQNN